MITQTNWIERKFEFHEPPGLFPCILERVRGAPARVEEMFRGVPAALLTARPGERWSAQEHLGHLWDLDELHDGRIDDYLEGRDVLRAADMKNEKTWKAAHNSRRAEDLLKGFREARARFAGRLEVLTEEQISRVAVHPRLGQPMRLVDMAMFVAEHDDHHMARMRALLRRPS